MRDMTRPFWHCIGGISLVLAAACGFAARPAHSTEPYKKDLTLYRHEGRYAAFPTLIQGDGDQLWVAFGWNTSRSHYGKAAGGQSGHVALYSTDGGNTWLEREKDAGYRPPPADKSLFVLGDGTRLSVSPLMHEVFPAEKKAELEAQGVAVKVWPDGNLSASYRLGMRRQLPGEARPRFSHASMPPCASIGGFGWGVSLPSDVILKPVYGLATRDDPSQGAWVLRSADRGDSWQRVVAAYDGRHAFNESDLLALPDGRVLDMIRNEGGKSKDPLADRGFLFQTESSDGGLTWSAPRRTEIWGYPPTLLRLRGGNLLCSYGYRRPPYGIRACFSRDGGRTWDAAHEAILRDDALSKGFGPGRGSTSDLGYPRTVELSDGSLLTVYYITLGDGVTHVAATRWSPDYRGPSHWPRGLAAIPDTRRNPKLPPERILGETGPLKFDYGVMQTFIPTQPQVAMIAVRMSRDSAQSELTHTHGLYVALRKPQDGKWWTASFASSQTIPIETVRIGGWNAFVFPKPVPVTPGEIYAFTLYNKDYLGGPTRIKPGLTGDHAWFVNTSQGQLGDYPNGSYDPLQIEDLAFKVYGEPGPLPADPR